jgi:hypothetical protein
MGPTWRCSEGANCSNRAGVLRVVWRIYWHLVAALAYQRVQLLWEAIVLGLHGDAVRELTTATGQVFSGSYDGSIGIW